MATEWFETFFQGIANEFWNRCTPPELTRAEADFIVEVLGCKPGAAILDIPCGNGRHCRELAARGFKMTGIDISREYIEAARAANESGVEWACANMRDLNRSGDFDGAFCMGNAFGYMEHHDTKKFVAAVARALKPGARFVLNAGTAEVILPRFREREWYEVGDIIFAETNRYVAERSCVETTFTFIRDGKVETRPGRQFVYTAAEVQRMLAEAGLPTVAIYGGVDRKPFQLGGEMYLVSERA
ncbi:MAG: class I SAM-dependent methyltransferase [Verrucomicrobia subdivision 3 bacterium]|nr:class I SAM-dependent methyltransferase [Limisphaerales bacterium]